MCDVNEFVRITLERERAERGLTWEELARDMQADPTTLWRWINDKSPIGSPQVENLLRIVLRQNPDLVAPCVNA